MNMSDKELKKIKKMMPSGATLAKLKSLMKKTKAGDRHPGTGARATVKSLLPKLKEMYPVSNKDVAFLKKSKEKQGKTKRKKTGPGSR
tara:strand:+ start:1953 stop:2216 length:264 start_codon:yes stop_codon:yes gene_type:complete